MQLFVVIQAVEDLLFSFVADGAGVVQDQIGGNLGIYLVVALMLQRADNFFRVVYIHLATEGLKVKGLFCCHDDPEYTAAGWAPKGGSRLR